MRQFTMVTAVAAVYWSLLSMALSVSSDWVNENIRRQINLPNHQGVEVAYTLEISKNGATKGPYELWIPTESDGGNIPRATCKEGNINPVDVQIEKRTDKVVLKVSLPGSFSAGLLVCQVVRVGKNARRPYPAEIAQLEKQRFLFEGDFLRMQSPYLLKGEESTEIFLPKGKVDILEELPDTKLNGNKVVSGPFKGAATESELSSRFHLQYDANFYFPVAKLVEREIEISHWGNVAVEEYYDVLNDGAKLKGEWSRLDHQLHNIPHSFQSLQASLPIEAYGVYYRDELGNVTTSNMWKPRSGKSTELLLKLRFPLYGGWHIEWYHGYNVPLTAFVSKVADTADRYLLDCELPQPINILAEKLILHVVLPPGATDVKIESPTKLRIASEKTFRRYTYLDVPWTARNVLSLELNDVIPESNSKTPENRLRVSYSYSNFHIVEKPLTVSGTIFAMLVGWMVWSRITQ